MDTKAKKYSFYSMVMCSILVGIMTLSNLIEYIQTGDPGSPFSNVCYILGIVCIMIGWIAYFIDKKKSAG